MSIKVMTAAWAVTLPHTDKIVLLALADNANDEGACYPSVTTLAAKCGLYWRSVLRVIDRLEKAGHVSHDQRVGRSSLYNVHPCLSDTPVRKTPLSQRHPPPVPETVPPLSVGQAPTVRGTPITVIEPSIEPSGNRQRAREVDPESFAEVQDAYPKRGGGQRWEDARAAYAKHRASGIAHAEILAGVRRYAEHIRAEGKEGTEFVQQAATFLGRNKGFTEPWNPVVKVRELSAVERVALASERKRDERVVAEQRGSSGSGMENPFGDVWQSPGTGLRRIGS